MGHMEFNTNHRLLQSKGRCRLARRERRKETASQDLQLPGLPRTRSQNIRRVT